MQKNVDILGKIVRSLMSSNVYNPNVNEFCMQYEAQVEVLGLLEKKVISQLQQQLQQSTSGTGTNPQRATILTKLKRDFERVQSQSKSFQELAIPKIKAIADANSAGKRNNLHSQGNTNFASDYSSNQETPAEFAQAEQQRLVQLQIQEDRLAAEIMREREEEIRNINRGMHQVNEIYKDLANIVGEQQEQIDTIETQMDESRANAEAGLKQVEKANEKYGNSNCIVM